MSLVSSRIGLRHRCTIERDANAATEDAWGNPQAPNWQPLATDVPCRAIADSGREPVDADRTVVVVDLRLLLPLGTDVTERDRISAVSERGAEYLDAPFGIEAVLRRRTHLELHLVRIR